MRRGTTSDGNRDRDIQSDSPLPVVQLHVQFDAPWSDHTSSLAYEQAAAVSLSAGYHSARYIGIGKAVKQGIEWHGIMAHKAGSGTGTGGQEAGRAVLHASTP